MGSCLSKKTTICSSTTALPDPPDQTKTKPQQSQVPEKKKPEEETTAKKEIFLIKHRTSHDSDRRSDEEKPKSDHKFAATNTSTSAAPAVSEAANGDAGLSNGGLPNGGIVVRTSSCSKEEIDAILIQCGRLSRSSSTGKAVAASGNNRKYSGSKRSYDFDHETGNGKDDVSPDDVEDIVDAGGGEDVRRHRQRHRQSTPSSSSGSRRRTPSRERDQQRSGSRERGGGSGGGARRVSRSPARRSESPITGNTNVNTITARPGKMVSVPATVSSTPVDKSGGGNGGADPATAAGIKRIAVKRNVGAASPRSRSPAAARVPTNVRVLNENLNNNSQTTNQQPLSLSRSNSRKAEQSPYRRNPLGEIDQNCIGFEVPNNKGSNNLSQAPIQKPNTENVKSTKVTVQGTDSKTNIGKGTTQENKPGTCWVKEQQQKMEDEGKGLQPMDGSLKPPPTITRSRSSRLSRDLDLNLNPEALMNPAPSSYTVLLLEDIQNFHQKGTPSISLPPCLTKACSILEAVADLNSSTVSNLSSSEQFGKKRYESKEPFVESEVIGNDDLMEPSFHKYVTVSRGGAVGGDADMEEVESSGSNSFVGGGQHWVSPSSWEPNSADSTDSWTSTRLGEKKREADHQRPGIGRNRVGSGRGLQSTPTLAAAAAT